MYTLVTGDTVLVFHTLKENDQPVDVSGMTVKSRLVGYNDREELIDPVTCDSGLLGADWANGKVGIVFPGSATQDINAVTHPRAWIETQAYDGTYHRTWFAEVAIVEGTID